MALTHHAAADCGCEDCRPHPLARNNYFTGKLMCERDFTDEQWFFREKIRLHHQRLHGTGVVCGLQIRQHPSPACQDRLVRLEPGSAIDCCGHDILVAEPDIFDFAQAPAVKNITDKKPHTLEFCLVWRECPAEDVPILYDECGCDDSQSAPNRILESYALEVRVDPVVHAGNTSAGTLHWGPTGIGIAGATAVALDETNQRLFVAAGTSPQTIYQYGTSHLLLEASYPTGGTVQSLALIPGGATLYAAINTTSGTAIQPLTPSATSLTASGTPLTTSKATATLVLTAGAPGLLGIDTTTGDYGFAQAPAYDLATAVTGTLNSASSAVVFATDGSTAWAVNGTTLYSITLPAGTANPSITLPAAITAATVIAVVPGGTGADLLAIAASSGDPDLHLYDPVKNEILGSTKLTVSAAAILVTIDGGTAIVTGTDDIQAVNLTALAQAATDAAGPDYKLEPGIGASAMLADGSRIYVPFTGDQGGVAIVTWQQHDCRSALLGQTCPACDTPDCLVLARVTGWIPGTKLLDTPNPAGNPPNGAAYIDNSVRTVLASTQAITNALLCLMDQPKPAAATPAPAPPAASATKLTHISAISWQHASMVTMFNVTNAGTVALEFAFDGPVNAADLMQPSALMVLVSVYTSPDSQNWLLSWCQVPVVNFGFSNAAVVPPGQLPVTPNWTVVPGPSGFGTTYPPSPATAPTSCTAVQIILDYGQLNSPATTAIDANQPLLVRVLLNGDLVRDGSANPLALDANHLPPWLGSPNYLTGDGIAGGLFESWFQLPIFEAVHTGNGFKEGTATERQPAQNKALPTQAKDEAPSAPPASKS